MIESTFLFLKIYALQLSEEFLNNARGTDGVTFSELFGQNIGIIIVIIVAIPVSLGIFLLARYSKEKFAFPEGRNLATYRIHNLNGSEFLVNISEDDSLLDEDLDELIDLGSIKTSPEIIKALKNDEKIFTYKGKITNYARNTKPNEKSKSVIIVTRHSLEDPSFFSADQKGAKGITNIFEPATIRNIYIHPISSVNEVKGVDGKTKQAYSLALIPTNKKSDISEYSNIFLDNHTSINIPVEKLDHTEGISNYIEWTTITAKLKRENKSKDNTIAYSESEALKNSKKASKMNMIINKLRSVVEQKALTGKDSTENEPVKIGSKIMLVMASVFVGAIGYTGWSGIEDLEQWSPWSGVIIASIILGVIVHANEKKRKSELAKHNIQIN